MARVRQHALCPLNGPVLRCLRPEHGLTEEADPDVADSGLRWRDLGSATTLTRTGTESASVHSGNVTLPATANARRLLIEDREALTEDVGGVPTATSVTACREVIDLPDDWV